jgi:hypothetical protein
MAAESNNTAQRTCPSCPPLNPLALFTHATPTAHLITHSTFLVSFLINSHPLLLVCTPPQQPPISCSGPAHKLTDS